MIQISKRTDAGNAWLVFSPVIAVLLTLLFGAVMFRLLGFSPLDVLEVYFLSPLADWFGISELLLKASPLILIGLGLSFVFKSNIWNIGAEGQYVMGGVAGSAVALFFYEADGFWLMPCVILAGVAGGILWAMIPALLKVKLNVNEILSSLMLNYVAVQLLLYLMHGPLRDPDGGNFPESKLFTDAVMLPTLFDGTRLNAGFIPLIVLILISLFVFTRSLFGFGVSVNGLSEKAAGYAGFQRTRLILQTMAVSGGMAGLAGIFEVIGPLGQLTAGFSVNYGYTAIVVAFLGRLHPLGVVLAGLIMALTQIGGENAQISMGLPFAATGVFQSLFLFFLLAGDFLRIYQIRFMVQHTTE